MYVDAPPQNAERIQLTFGQKAFQWASIVGIIVLGVYQKPLVDFTTEVFKNIL